MSQAIPSLTVQKREVAAPFHAAVRLIAKECQRNEQVTSVNGCDDPVLGLAPRAGNVGVRPAVRGKQANKCICRVDDHSEHFEAARVSGRAPAVDVEAEKPGNMYA